MEATGVIMNFIKITDDFWIGEVDNYPEQARDLLKEEYRTFDPAGHRPPRCLKDRSRQDEIKKGKNRSRRPPVS